ncbi:hypothetical protein QVD17_30902 [Tagetes erecta]|uniref:Retrotransposon gag domain-containing protein n=1 Tax=Tagetes erecta TaxID=13708 RepID=A0AAD8K2D3_TARER|nr:hypothetical protein QVD17_30902 [Tagetes erecta]
MSTRLELLANTIATQMANILPNLVNQLNAANENKEPKALHCTLKYFNSCGPTKFFGTKGATGLLHWYESMESIFVNCDCPDDFKVRYATSVLQKGPLTWWNDEKRRCGEDEIWDEFKSAMTDKYCPPCEIRRRGEDEIWDELKGEFWALKQDNAVWGSKPDTVGEAMTLAGRLTENHVRAGTLTRKGNKKLKGSLVNDSKLSGGGSYKGFKPESSSNSKK